MRIVIFLLVCSLFQHVAAQGFMEYMITNHDRTYHEIVADMNTYYATHARERGSGFKQYMRWTHYAETHLLSNGKVANSMAMNAAAHNKYLKSHREALNTMRATHGAWNQEGPTSYTTFIGSSTGLGRINRLTFHPNSDAVFASTAGGGLWRTMDSGNSWTPMTDALPLNETSGLAIHPLDDDIMYLLTGDGDQWSSKSIGVLKTTNAGGTWSPTGLTWNIVDSAHVRAYHIVIHPGNPEMLFVVSSKGIHRSADAAASWSLIQTGHFTDIEFHPTDPSILYAAAIDGFYRSTNGGQSFTHIPDADFPSQFVRIEIAVTPADSSVVYLLFGGHETGTGNGTYSGLCFSNNFGIDFTLKSNTPNILGASILGDDSLHQADYDLALAADPFDADIIYVGGINNWRSENQGETWQVLTHWADNGAWPFVHADQHFLAFRDHVLFCANDGGIYTYTPTTGDWNEWTQGMCITQPYNIDVRDDRILLGSQDNGTMRWDLGETIATAEFGGDGFDCMWDPTPPFGAFGSLYVTWQSDILISNNDGFSFGSIGVPGFGAGQYWFVDLMMHPTNHDTIYTAVGQYNSNSDLFRSYNRGGTWTDMNCGLGYDITTITQSETHPNIVFAATEKNIVRTLNIHAPTPVWTTLPTLPVAEGDRSIRDIVIDPDDPAVIYVCLARYVDGAKIFMSVDTGNSWTPFTGSLPNVPFYSLLIDDDNNNGLYAGSDIGVFYRNMNMTDWIYYGNDLPSVPVYDLDIDQDKLYAGTFGRGIWSTSLYSTCVPAITLSTLDPNGGVQVYHALDLISSSQVINGGIGTDIQYSSGNQITLTNGFEVKAHNLFQAKLGDCPD